MITDAHQVGLTIHGWTFRRENQFLPADFRSSADPNAVADLAAEINTFSMPGWTASSPTTPTSA